MIRLSSSTSLVSVKLLPGAPPWLWRSFSRSKMKKMLYLLYGRAPSELLFILVLAFGFDFLAVLASFFSFFSAFFVSATAVAFFAPAKFPGAPTPFTSA
eukprot:CAMPEP_0172547160 /NCGR_PEP_ID=MMETSP1067-20121228/16755_1 /TAXON_ID=265564 ORGANISM="Thalassiosira punctigera, Strain Tpunct2005C2" /NCGR_SAMPLE_ID=MMETSP1067 /ASSEMBLY_ACC=CAM_ASM_000444 /LENGTH=98 /DNA_ID=CAMNT_0013334197 /DNA_START=528 /DNA_END=824 /DNA_ORIENTATION=-